MTDTLYTATSGTTGHINGERGTVVLIDYAQGFRRGAFVRLDERPVMLYAELGASVGERGGWSEVVSVREIDRDEFDRLTGLAGARREMGWDFSAHNGFDHCQGCQTTFQAEGVSSVG